MKWFFSIGVGVVFFITSLTIAYTCNQDVRRLLRSCHPRCLHNRFLCYLIVKWDAIGRWAGTMVLASHPSDEELKILYERVSSLRERMVPILVECMERDVEPVFGVWLADTLLCWAHLHRMTFFSQKEQELAIAIMPKARKLLDDSFGKVLEIHDDISPEYLTFVTLWSNDDEVKVRAGKELLKLSLHKTNLFVLAERVPKLWPEIADMLQGESLTCEELEIIARHVPTAEWARKKWEMIRHLPEK